MSGTVCVHLVRHGESLWNVEGRYQGQADSGLTAAGRAQAAAFAVAFAAEVPAPDMVFSSDLPRALDTARKYADTIGVEIGLDGRLREMSVGDWAGLTFDEAAEKYPETVMRVAAGEDLARGIGGETFAETRERAVAAVSDVFDDPADDDTERVVVAFSSGNPIRLIAADVLGLPVPGHATLAAPDNCSVTTIRLRHGRRELVRYNHSVAPAAPADVREIS